MDTVKFSSTMSVTAFLLFMLLAVSSALEMSIANNRPNYGPPKRSDSEVRAMFESWLVQNGKNYNAIGEKEVRYQIFKDNLRFIDEHNSKELTYKVGLNVFSDLTLEEYRSTYLSELPESTFLFDANVSTTSVSVEALPDSVDWRTTGAVGPVRNQGSCGSCWAFTTAAAIEGINHIVSKKFVQLSPQQLLDCSSYSCKGGSRPGALQWVKKNGGLASEADYPYTGRKGPCKSNAWTVSISDYGSVKPRNEDALKEAVFRQPIAVGMDSSNNAFKQYKSGIFSGPCGTALDHSVLLIGYGSENGVDYWLFKNSWGANWGEKGYFRLKRNVGGLGTCGILTSPCYPIKAYASDNGVAASA